MSDSILEIVTDFYFFSRIHLLSSSLCFLLLMTDGKLDYIYFKSPLHKDFYFSHRFKFPICL